MLMVNYSIIYCGLLATKLNATAIVIRQHLYCNAYQQEYSCK